MTRTKENNKLKIIDANEARKFLGALKGMGIELPEDCRIETTIENHDWLSSNTKAFASDNGPVIICNVGGGNIARAVYRIVSYAHLHEAIGKHKKTLLHDEKAQERK